MVRFDTTLRKEDITDDFKERLIKIIEKSLHGIIDSDGDAAILFHWVRHKDDPVYSFVPEEYRRF